MKVLDPKIKTVAVALPTSKTKVKFEQTKAVVPKANKVVIKKERKVRVPSSVYP